MGVVNLIFFMLQMERCELDPSHANAKRDDVYLILSMLNQMGRCERDLFMLKAKMNYVYSILFLHVKARTDAVNLIFLC